MPSLRDQIFTSPTYLELLRESSAARLFMPHIDGIEVTQAIQYYHSEAHLTDRADRGRDNAIEMAAGKPAWVRVYVRSGLRGGETRGVTGKLEVLRKSGDFTYQSVTTLLPISPGSVVARADPSYDTERSNTFYSLNFVIPARQPRILERGSFDVMCGVLKLRVTIETPGGHTDSMEAEVRATLQQTLRVRVIPVTYSGPASSAMGAPVINIAAPTIANVQSTAALALTLYPVQSRGEYSRAAAITQTQHLQDTVAPGGGCSTNWNNLLAAVQQARIDDGNRSDWLYYGLLPTGTPVGTTQGTNSGCGADGIGAGTVGDQVTMAHELIHACGIKHAPCAPAGGSVGTTADRVELNYPAYEPYDPANTPQASIGEYGLNISTGQVFSPRATKDLMSYCGPVWISLYTYNLLQNNKWLAPKQVCRPPTVFDEAAYDPFWWLPGKHPEDPIMRERLISIIGVVHGPERVEVTSVMRVEAERALRDASATRLTAQLIGANGGPVAEGGVYALNAFGGGGCCCDEGAEPRQYPYVFQTFVPDVEPGAALVIRQDDRELWTRRAPDSAPQVGSLSASASEEGLALFWEAYTTGENAPEVWAQWSNDDGQTWNGLAVGLTDNQALITSAGLPAGTVLVRLLVGDGFNTVASEPAAVEIPRAAPGVSIFAPRERQILPARGPVRLWGAAVSNSGAEIADDNAQWILDDREPLPGFDVFTGELEPGEHRAILRVSEDDWQSEAVVYFTVAEPLRED